ncbi:HypC/HybG/HupF family hydrogenase formation chaperone [bacterium]|nr:HypC/HybG/HupF family hydrogenase formation chaperone [bacterium]
MCLAIPGKVIEIFGDDSLLHLGLVNFGGTIKEVSLAFVPEVKIGDFVYVHVGVALSIIDETIANEVFGYLNTLSEEGYAGSEST